MPSHPGNIFETLRLSKNPAFQKLKPEQAATIARGFRDFLASDEIKQKLLDFGGPQAVSDAAGIVDVELGASAIEASRERARPSGSFISEGLRGFGEGAAGVVQAFGLDEPLLEQFRIQMNQLAAQFLGGDPRPFGDRPEDPGQVPADAFPPRQEDFGTVGLPIIGDVNIPQASGMLAASLPPIVGAIGVAGEALSVAGLTAIAPKLASMLSFSLGASGIEALRQEGRAQFRGEERDPVGVATEGAIFAIPGIPQVTKVPLVRKAATRAATGVATAGVSIGADIARGKPVDWDKAMTLFGFTGLFGNPALKNRAGELVTGVSGGVAVGKSVPRLRGVTMAQAEKIQKLHEAVKAENGRRVADRRVSEQGPPAGTAERRVIRQEIKEAEKFLEPEDAAAGAKAAEKELFAEVPEGKVLDFTTRAPSDAPFRALRGDSLFQADTVIHKYLTGKKRPSSLSGVPVIKKPLTPKQSKEFLAELSPEQRKELWSRIEPVPDPKFKPGPVEIQAARQIRQGEAVSGVSAKGRKTARGLSFRDLQAKAREFDAQIREAEDGGFLGIGGGREVELPTLKDVNKYLSEVEDLANGIVPKKPTQPVVDTAAMRKLKQVIHTGKGKYDVVDSVTGEVQKVVTLKAAAKLLAEAKLPEAIELVPGAKHLRSDQPASVGGPSHQGRFPVDPSDATFPGGFVKFAATKGKVMQMMEDASGSPVWSQVWEPGQRAQQVRDAWQTPHYVSLRGALKGVRAGRKQLVQDLFIAGDKLPQVAQEMGAKAVEIKAVRELEKFYKDLLNLNNKELKFIQEEMIPAFRESGGSPLNLKIKGKLPESMVNVVEDIMKGRIHMEEPNAQVLASELILAQGRHKFMRPFREQADVIKRQLKQDIVRKGQTAKGSQQATNMLAVVNDYVDNVVHGFGGNTGASISKAMNAVQDAFVKTGLLKKEGKWTAREVDSISQQFASHVSMTALSARPAMAVRNYFQRLLPGYSVGFPRIWKAQKEAITPEGFQLIKESGVIPREVLFLADDIAQGLTPDVSIPRSIKEIPAQAIALKDSLLKLQRAGLWLYRKADHGNRGVSYLAGRGSVMEHAKLLLPDPRSGKISAAGHKKFMVETGLAGKPQVVQKRVLRFLENSDAAAWDINVQKAGREYGIRLAQESQFVYNKANAPQWMQGVPGRMFGQFGMWPIAYAEFMIQGTKGASFPLAPIVTRLGAQIGGRAAEVSAADIAASNFALRAIMVGGATTLVGVATGIDTSSFNRTNPMNFEGGPQWQAARDLVTSVSGAGNEFDRSQAAANLTRFIVSNGTPFGAAAQDARQAIEAADEGNIPKAIALVLGFNIADKGGVLNE